MQEFLPVTAYIKGVDPEGVWLQAHNGDCGVATFMDCQWMRGDGEEVADCFRWDDDESGNHVEMDDIEFWRPATRHEDDFAWSAFMDRVNMHNEEEE